MRIEVNAEDLETILAVMDHPIWPPHQFEAAKRLRKDLDGITPTHDR